MSTSEKLRQKKIKEYVIKRDESTCCYCNAVLDYESITLDHIVPDSKRGTFNSTNLTVSCYPCNNKRGNKPFFEYIKDFNFDENKIGKYKKLYFNNLKIKVLNIAKEHCLTEPFAVPLDLIRASCQILKIKNMDFSNYEKTYQFEINFKNSCEKKKIKYCFEQLIRLIEAESE